MFRALIIAIDRSKSTELVSLRQRRVQDQGRQEERLQSAGTAKHCNRQSDCQVCKYIIDLTSKPYLTLTPTPRRLRKHYFIKLVLTVLLLFQ